MSKQIIFDDKARQKVLSGVNQLAAAVRITMGPKGRNVLLEKKFGGPVITNDGVTIAKEIDLKDPEENVGAQLVKEVATRTNDVAGDGTTTATVLAAEMLKSGIFAVTSGANPIFLKRGMDKALAIAIKKLNQMSRLVKSKREIAQVATISAQDREVGEIITELMEKVGHDGAITVEETKHGMGISMKVVEGMQFDKGYVSAYMVTDTARMEAAYEDVPLLLTDKKISSFKDLLPLLEQLVQSGKKELVIVAEDVDGDALTNILLNKIRGGLSILAVKTPGFGDRGKEMLRDIAVLTGATVISEELGLKLETTTLEHLGHAGKVVSTKDHTMIVDGKGEKQAIEARVTEIKAMMEHSKSDFDREKMMERVAKLSGGVGVIEVGAASEVELKERKMRIEDALNATKAAVKEGIVAGGGAALVHASKALLPLVEQLIPSDPSKNTRNADSEKLGVTIVMSAMHKPLRQIAENAGESGDVVFEKVFESSNEAYGYDALADDRALYDMFEAGIVDPTMVTRSALENAVSVAGTILTTGAVVTEIPEEKSAGAGMPDMSGMM